MLVTSGQTDNSSKQDSTAAFLPSTLIDSEQRGILIKAFKELVGSVSLSQSNAAMTSQWSLIHSASTMQ
jgi:hypothetical protein